MLLDLALWFPASLLIAETNKPTEKKYPNIIHIMTDDVGYDDLSCFGSEDIHIPNLDALAPEDIKFTSFYAPHGICTSSHAALLTSRYTI